jgi:protein involved in polysaccharide export with SLBB domain
MMKKNSLMLGILWIAWAAASMSGAEIASFVEYDDVFGQRFLDTSLSDPADPAFKADSALVGVLPDYILKPHDEVNVDIWGSLDLHYALSIGADGYVIIPEVGRISLSGLTYAEAKKKILTHLAFTYAFFVDAENPGVGKAQVDITLGRTAGINVFVTGEVKKPGSVNINGINASIINILRKSGINHQASIRKIELRKLGGKIYVFDLYDFLLKGNLPAEFKYLNDGDIIFVQLRDKEVNITGSVRRPGRYELLTGEKLNEAIKIAGGALSDAQKVIRIFRKTYNESGERIDEIRTGIDSDCVLEDRDVIDISGSYDAGEKYYVTVSGEVKQPGNYTYLKHEKVNELIVRCGGLSNEAFLEGSQFIRNNALAMVDLGMALRDPGSMYNFTLLPGDKIIIPKPDSFIVVKGAVLSPSGIFFKEGEKADYYIKRAGGYKDNADRDNVTIITSGGAVEKAHKGFWTSNPPVPLGATIEVPQVKEPAASSSRAAENPAKSNEEKKKL